MRIAIVSDIHDNLTALEAVLADLRAMSPDLVLHGGDVSGSGSSPAEVVDLIRDLGWPGVCGNTDEMLFRAQALDEFLPGMPHVREMAAWTRDRLGEERIAWLRELPRLYTVEGLALVHAGPRSLWRSPADETEFASLERPLAVFGHIHRPYIRELAGFTLANSGSVGLPCDGDPRASYLLIDDAKPTIRRVPYDLSKEIEALARCALPHSAWMAKMLTAASPQMP